MTEMCSVTHQCTMKVINYHGKPSKNEEYIVYISGGLESLKCFCLLFAKWQAIFLLYANFE